MSTKTEQEPLNEEQQIAAYANIFQQLGKDGGSRAVILQAPPQERNVPIIGLFRNVDGKITCEVKIGPANLMGKTYPAELSQKAQQRRATFLQSQDNDTHTTPDLYGSLKQILELGRAIKTKNVDPTVIAGVNGWYFDEKNNRLMILQEPVTLGYYAKSLTDEHEMFTTNSAFAHVVSAPLAITFTQGARTDQRQNLNVFYHALDAVPYEGTLTSLIPALQKELDAYQSVTDTDPVEWWPTTSNLCFSVQCRDVTGTSSSHVADVIVYANNSVQKTDGTTEYVFESNAKKLAVKIMETLTKSFAKAMPDSLEVKNFIAKKMRIVIQPMRVTSFSLSVFKGKNGRSTDNRFLVPLEAHCSKISTKTFGSDVTVPGFLDFPFGRACAETENGKQYEHPRNTGYRSFIVSEGGNLFPMKLRGALVLKKDKENRVWVHSFAPAPETLAVQDITLLGFNIPFLSERYSDVSTVPIENRLIALMGKDKGEPLPIIPQAEAEKNETAAPQVGKAVAPVVPVAAEPAEAFDVLMFADGPDEGIAANATVGASTDMLTDNEEDFFDDPTMP